MTEVFNIYKNQDKSHIFDDFQIYNAATLAEFNAEDPEETIIPEIQFENDTFDTQSLNTLYSNPQYYINNSLLYGYSQNMTINDQIYLISDDIICEDPNFLKDSSNLLIENHVKPENFMLQSNEDRLEKKLNVDPRVFLQGQPVKKKKKLNENSYNNQQSFSQNLEKISAPLHKVKIKDIIKLNANIHKIVSNNKWIFKQGFKHLKEIHIEKGLDFTLLEQEFMEYPSVENLAKIFQPRIFLEKLSDDKITQMFNVSDVYEFLKILSDDYEINNKHEAKKSVYLNKRHTFSSEKNKIISKIFYKNSQNVKNGVDKCEDIKNFTNSLIKSESCQLTNDIINIHGKEEVEENYMFQNEAVVGVKLNLDDFEELIPEKAIPRSFDILQQCQPVVELLPLPIIYNEEGWNDTVDSKKLFIPNHTKNMIEKPESKAISTLKKRLENIKRMRERSVVNPPIDISSQHILIKQENSVDTSSKFTNSPDDTNSIFNPTSPTNLKIEELTNDSGGYEVDEPFLDDEESICPNFRDYNLNDQDIISHTPANNKNEENTKPPRLKMNNAHGEGRRDFPKLFTPSSIINQKRQHSYSCLPKSTTASRGRGTTRKFSSTTLTNQQYHNHKRLNNNCSNMAAMAAATIVTKTKGTNMATGDGVEGKAREIDRSNNASSLTMTTIEAEKRKRRYRKRLPTTTLLDPLKSAASKKILKSDSVGTAKKLDLIESYSPSPASAAIDDQLRRNVSDQLRQILIERAVRAIGPNLITPPLPPSSSKALVAKDTNNTSNPNNNNQLINHETIVRHCKTLAEAIESGVKNYARNITLSTAGGGTISNSNLCSPSTSNSQLSLINSCSNNNSNKNNSLPPPTSSYSPLNAYRAKQRALTYNLTDPKNKVFSKVISGEIEPERLVRMSQEEISEFRSAQYVVSSKKLAQFILRGFKNRFDNNNSSTMRSEKFGDRGNNTSFLKTVKFSNNPRNNINNGRPLPFTKTLSNVKPPERKIASYFTSPASAARNKPPFNALNRPSSPPKLTLPPPPLPSQLLQSYNVITKADDHVASKLSPTTITTHQISTTHSKSKNTSSLISPPGPATDPRLRKSRITSLSEPLIIFSPSPLNTAADSLLHTASNSVLPLTLKIPAASVYLLRDNNTTADPTAVFNDSGMAENYEVGFKLLLPSNGGNYDSFPSILRHRERLLNKVLALHSIRPVNSLDDEIALIDTVPPPNDLKLQGNDALLIGLVIPYYQSSYHVASPRSAAPASSNYLKFSERLRQQLFSTNNLDETTGGSFTFTSDDTNTTSTSPAQSFIANTATSTHQLHLLPLQVQHQQSYGNEPSSSLPLHFPKILTGHLRDKVFRLQQTFLKKENVVPFLAISHFTNINNVKISTDNDLKNSQLIAAAKPLSIENMEILAENESIKGVFSFLGDLPHGDIDYRLLDRFSPEDLKERHIKYNNELAQSVLTYPDNNYSTKSPLTNKLAETYPKNHQSPHHENSDSIDDKEDDDDFAAVGILSDIPNFDELLSQVAQSLKTIEEKMGETPPD